ncbi:phage tail protein [Thiolapillus sp.]
MRQSEIAKLLPSVFQQTCNEGQPLAGLLSVMERMHEPSETVLDGIESYFDAYRTPAAFLPYLARWLDLDRIFPEDCRQGGAACSTGIAEGNLRELVAAATELSQWRGTSDGLLRFLEIGTGMSGFEIQELVRAPDGSTKPFHIRVVAPGNSRPFRPLIERVIDQEKPAHVTYELIFRTPSERGKGE